MPAFIVRQYEVTQNSHHGLNRPKESCGLKAGTDIQFADAFKFPEELEFKVFVVRVFMHYLLKKYYKRTASLEASVHRIFKECVYM